MALPAEETALSHARFVLIAPEPCTLQPELTTIDANHLINAGMASTEQNPAAASSAPHSTSIELGTEPIIPVSTDCPELDPWNGTENALSASWI